MSKYIPVLVLAIMCLTYVHPAYIFSLPPSLTSKEKLLSLPPLETPEGWTDLVASFKDTIVTVKVPPVKPSLTNQNKYQTFYSFKQGDVEYSIDLTRNERHTKDPIAIRNDLWNHIKDHYSMVYYQSWEKQGMIYADMLTLLPPGVSWAPFNAALQRVIVTDDVIISLLVTFKTDSPKQLTLYQDYFFDSLKINP